MNRALWCSLLVLGAACACVTAQPAPDAVPFPSPTPRPSAEIGREVARFVFPTERDSTFMWNAHEPGKYPGYPEYYRTLAWRPRRTGTDPQQVTIVVRWDSSGVRRGPLSALLRTARVEVGTLCFPCEPTALTISEDTVFTGRAITAHTEGSALVVIVRGRSAISRLFRDFPDSVWMSFTGPSGHQGDTTVAVRRLR